MLRYIYGDDLDRHPRLAATMFRDRAEQFSARLGWGVTVDGDGRERDVYDDLNPLYVIWERPDGCHGGSMRFLPTTGRTMVNEHFASLVGGEVRSPLIWECTRFCLAPGERAAPALMLGAVEVGLNFGLAHLVGVFDAPMRRVYRGLGWAPDVAGTEGEGRQAISAGFWAISAQVRAGLLARAGIGAAQSRAWFDASFGAPLPLPLPRPRARAAG